MALPEILQEVKPYFKNIKAVAVTNQPGLGVTLIEGIAMAKTIASLLNTPLIAVNHLKGHIYSLFIESDTIFPLLVLLISGGHTQILKVISFDKMEILASSMDDSIGESFDKCSKMMGLGYPGGPIVEDLAKEGDEDRFDLPVPLRNSPLIAFSLSGLKNAVRLKVEKLGGKEKLTHKDRCDISASFQKAIKLHLIQKTKKIFQNEDIKDFTIVGGASANIYIREAYKKLCKEFNKNIHFVELQYCSDNSVMIGRYAIDAYDKKDFISGEDLENRSTKKQISGDFL